MPTVLRIGRFRFFFFSNEREEPPHIHVKAVPSAVVANYVRKEHQAFLNEKPNRKTSDRRTFRIGLPNDRNVEAPAPLASDYEDKWELMAAPSVHITPEVGS